MRRRILELLADGEETAGAVSGSFRAEFGSRNRRYRSTCGCCEGSGFATVPADGTRPLYAVDSAQPQEVDMWLERFRQFWSQRLDALGTELARGKRERREQRENTAGTPSAGRQPSTKSEEDT